MNQIEELLKRVLTSLLVDMVISGARGGGEFLKIKIRPVVFRDILYFQVSKYTDKQVFHENLTAEEAAQSAAGWIMNDFRQAQIRTQDEMVTVLASKKGKLTIKEKVKSTTMLMLAVTLHNIPEGMAVGVAFAGLFSQNTGITLAEAFALAIGIAIQNIPEGAIISMPLHSSGKSKFKSFLGGTLSGIVEPIGAIITIALTRIVVPILPYFLSFAAGAMIYVVSSELIPEAQAEKKSNLVTISVGIGFVIMMLLDVALG